jgi:hypothetical protein
MDYAQLRARHACARGSARRGENIVARGRLISHFDKHSPHLERFLHLRFYPWANVE